VRQICIKISERAPEFGVGVLLPELLQDTGTWDILLIGLQTLITILLSAPARQQASQGEADPQVLLLFCVCGSMHWGGGVPSPSCSAALVR